MIYFLGSSHAAIHLRDAAIQRGVPMALGIDQAKIIFISEDTPTDEHGNRDLQPIRNLIQVALGYGVPIVLTSQVPPGFTRSLKLSGIYHLAETLRIKDAMQRALSPEQFILGCANPEAIPDCPLPDALRKYFQAFGDVPVHYMTLEEAEFAKIAINLFLAAQVDITNRLAKAAEKVDARWEPIANVLRHDKRIGPHAYLTPGRWQDSKHLLRDHVTLQAIE